MRKDHRLGTILAFTAGAAVGALVGLLAAPKSGEDLRDDVVDAVNDGFAAPVNNCSAEPKK
jgi:gas vesicle protein